jgi:hypothetical protein
VRVRRRAFASSPDVKTGHEFSQLGRAYSATAGQVPQQGVRVGDARATGDDLSADDRLNRLREHLPIRLEVGSEHVLHDEDLSEPALQII